jgi:hypothetical protein
MTLRQIARSDASSSARNTKSHSRSIGNANDRLLTTNYFLEAKAQQCRILSQCGNIGSSSGQQLHSNRGPADMNVFDHHIGDESCGSVAW